MTTFQQISLLDAIQAAQERPEPPLSFSAQVVAAHHVDCPPEPTFKPSQKQLRAVYDVMKCGAWFTLWEIAEFAKLPPTAIPAVSARIRDLDRLYGRKHEKRRAKDGGLWEYRLLPRIPHEVL